MTRTVVITGTATGMGKATVEKFAREGWNVVATVRKPEDLSVHGGVPGVRTLQLDVDDEKADSDFAALALAQFGQVDALVNNAGYYQMGPLESSTMEQIHRQFQTNVFGLIAVTKAFLPVFRQQRSGTIINISSISAEQGYPYTAVYAASKAAVATLTEGLSIELAEFGVTAKAVLPGQFATRIFTKIDGAAAPVAAYQTGIQTFFANNAPNGSEPSVTAEVIFAAVTDGDPTKVRYYSGPDGTAIPLAKRILGQEGYWREFRDAVAAKPSQLWRTLVPPPGGTPVEFVI